jgi:hypothetical protein
VLPVLCVRQRVRSFWGEGHLPAGERLVGLVRDDPRPLHGVGPIDYRSVPWLRGVRRGTTADAKTLTWASAEGINPGVGGYVRFSCAYLTRLGCGWCARAAVPRCHRHAQGARQMQSGRLWLTHAMEMDVVLRSTTPSSSLQQRLGPILTHLARVGGFARRQVKSPFGPFKLTTNENGTAIKCPITGSTLKNRYCARPSQAQANTPHKLSAELADSSMRTTSCCALHAQSSESCCRVRCGEERS